MSEQEPTIENDLEVYGKLLDYKRGVGSTQWTILSLFITAAGGVFAYSFSVPDWRTGLGVRLFGFAIYLFGYLLYKRYYKMNGFVADYLCTLEERTGYRFQHSLNEKFHAEGISTDRLLYIGGFVYLVFSGAACFLPVAAKTAESAK